MAETARLTCSDVRKQLSDYLDGSVDVETAQHIRWHLGRCKNCRFIVHSAVETFRQQYRQEPAGVPARKAHAA